MREARGPRAPEAETMFVVHLPSSYRPIIYIPVHNPLLFLFGLSVGLYIVTYARYTEQKKTPVRMCTPHL